MPAEWTAPIELNAPLTAYGEAVKAVRLRAPTIGELRQCGQPYSLVGSGGSAAIKADYDACARLLEHVCDPPLPSMAIDAMDPADFDELAMRLVGFTKRAPRGGSANPSPPSVSSTEPATSPGSGA